MSVGGAAVRKISGSPRNVAGPGGFAAAFIYCEPGFPGRLGKIVFGWSRCSQFHKSFEFVHNGKDEAPDAEGVGAADDFEQAAGREFFD